MTQFTQSTEKAQSDIPRADIRDMAYLQFSESLIISG